MGGREEREFPVANESFREESVEETDQRAIGFLAIAAGGLAMAAETIFWGSQHISTPEELQLPVAGVMTVGGVLVARMEFNAAARTQKMENLFSELETTDEEPEE